MKEKLVVLSCYGDGDIETMLCPSVKGAQEHMLELYVRFVTGESIKDGKYSGKTFSECVKDKDLNDEANGTHWIGDESAYFYNEKTMKEYAWSIKELFPEMLSDPSCLEVQTRMGALIARKVCAHPDLEGDYPGIEVLLSLPNKTEERVALIEVDQTDREAPVFKSHIYSADRMEDEPIFDYEAAKEEFDAGNTGDKEEEK